MSDPLVRPESWGYQLRRWRDEQRHWTQQDLVDQIVRVAFETREARGTQIDTRLINRWESGAVARPQATYRRLLSVLGAPLPESHIRAPAAQPGSSPSKFNGHATGLLIVPADARAEPRPERLDVTDLVQVRERMKRLVELDNQFGAGEIARTGARLFRYLHHNLGSGTYEPAIRSDLLATAAEVAEITGWLAYDADDQGLVRRMNNEALHYSRLAGDTTIELLTLQNASMHAGFLGRPNEALDIADAVLNGRFNLTPRVRSLFLIRKARALAQGGDGSALVLMQQARSLYGDGVSDRDPHWAWWIDERELSWHEAMCRTDLGDQSTAHDSFERSVEATPAHETRSQYLHRAYLLRAQTNGRSWDRATATMNELTTLAMQVSSNRTALIIRHALDGERAAGVLPSAVADAGRQLTLIMADPTAV